MHLELLKLTFQLAVAVFVAGSLCCVPILEIELLLFVWQAKLADTLARFAHSGSCPAGKRFSNGQEEN